MNTNKVAPELPVSSVITVAPSTAPIVNIPFDSVSIVAPQPNNDRPFPMEGITMDGIVQFIQQVGVNKLVGLTTTEVCAFVKDYTKKEQLSYCAVLMNNGSFYVGKANIFVSHAWKYTFLGVVDALQHQLSLMSAEEKSKAVFWFDLFSNNQHGLETAAPPFSWWCNTFMTAIKTIGKVLMVIEPWSNPITLTRAWCLWEVYCCFVTNSTFAVAMSNKETAEYRRLIVEDPNQFLVMLSQIDIRKSEAFNPLDRKQIFEVVEQAVGFERLNQMVLDCIRRWTIRDLNQWLSEVRKLTPVNKLHIASLTFTLAKILISMDYFNKQTLDWLKESYVIRCDAYGKTSSQALEVERQILAWKANEYVNGNVSLPLKLYKFTSVVPRIRALERQALTISELIELKLVFLRLQGGSFSLEIKFCMKNWNNLPKNEYFVLKVQILNAIMDYYHRSIEMDYVGIRFMVKHLVSFVVEKYKEIEPMAGNNLLGLLKLRLSIIRALPYSNEVLQESLTIVKRLGEAFGEQNDLMIFALTTVGLIAFYLDNQAEYKKASSSLFKLICKIGSIRDLQQYFMFFPVFSACVSCNSVRHHVGCPWQISACGMCPFTVAMFGISAGLMLVPTQLEIFGCWCCMKKQSVRPAPF